MTDPSWWLSFAGDTPVPLADQVPGGPGFRGVVIVEAPTMFLAALKATMLGINPGGEVMGMAFPSGILDSGWYDRLLTQGEAEQVDEEMAAAYQRLINDQKED